MTAPIDTIFLISSDPSLRNELESEVPSGFLVETSGHGEKPGEKKEGRIIFFDTDSYDAARALELARDNFIIAVTAQERTGVVMEAASFGAYEVLLRPLRKETVGAILKDLKALRTELSQVIDISKDTIVPAATCAIVGRSTLILDLCKKLARIAQVEVPVLITGETGTGKELIAEAIAQLSSRFGKPFEVVNCAAIPDTLLESELFGYERGAFTGATAPKEGILKIADGGCVFFDEVGELPLALQGKLLRFLQTQTFHPLGGAGETQVNVRVISATNRDLGRMVREGKFREDLYHRLRVAIIHIPPLRERKKDIAPLAQCLFYRHSHTAQKNVRGVTKAFLDRLLAHDWPGNIRELENTIRSAIALAKTPYLTTRELSEMGEMNVPLQGQDFSGALASVVLPELREMLEKGDKDIYEQLHNVLDRHLLNSTLSYAGGNQSEAARLLGISRLTLRKKMGL
jgi:two-component system nitrogen regulation response regulator GlnG